MQSNDNHNDVNLEDLENYIIKSDIKFGFIALDDLNIFKGIKILEDFYEINLWYQKGDDTFWGISAKSYDNEFPTIIKWYYNEVGDFLAPSSESIGFVHNIKGAILRKLKNVLDKHKKGIKVAKKFLKLIK